MTEQQKKAFDFASDVIKQLITLATGIIAITITFSKDIVGASMLTDSITIFISWGLFILSIICGILALLALTGTLDPLTPSDPPTVPSVNSNSIKLFSAIQILSFIAGLICTVVFGITAINDAKGVKIQDNDSVDIIQTTEYKLMTPKKSEKKNYSVIK